MKKRIAIPIIAILAILVVGLGVLQVTTLRRFVRGTAKPDGTKSPDAVSSASMLLQSGSFDYIREACIALDSGQVNGKIVIRI